MNEAFRIPVTEWTVDYGDGRDPLPVTVPHAWQQDVPVAFEGPVIYKTLIEVPPGESHLRFSGVSYAAEVSIEGEAVATHRGIWDAFDVPLSRFAGRRVNLEVSVVKNGGATYPVREVASGFLPFVYHTFGGIHGEVEIFAGAPTLDLPPFDIGSRVAVEGSEIYVDDLPFYVRGILTWGWYPDVGHTNPPEEVIRKEVAEIKALGFNLIKFCLWVPPHRYLEIMREEGLEAWMELPLWDPTDHPDSQQAIAQEMERIVRQYRHHSNILVWTVGCELSTSTSPEYRQYLTRMVQGLTGSPLVKDNSGSAEMYGGDLREFGTFYDFHPYCDTPFYGPVLDTLLTGPRPRLPILLGEFNDIDVHRDLARLGDEMPYWASTLPELNDMGVRWQKELPEVVAECRFSLHPIRDNHSTLMQSSRKKALFIRKTVHEMVRSRQDIGGYVITGHRDTPISTAGFFDDWGDARFSADELEPWNSETCVFQIPVRRPPWVNGGNRPGFLDAKNFFTGQLFWRIGVHSQFDLASGLVWKVRRRSGEVIATGAEEITEIPALESREVGQISVFSEDPGEYVLEVEFGGAHNSWPIWVVDKPGDFADWKVFDPVGLLGIRSETGDKVLSTELGRSEPGLVFLTGEGTVPCPFWREATYEFRNDGFWSTVPFREEWERLLPISPDCALDPETLGEHEVLLNRIDTRTYVERPVLARVGNQIVTTLRPFGGLGDQPTSLMKNPAGVEFIRRLAEAL